VVAVFLLPVSTKGELKSSPGWGSTLSFVGFLFNISSLVYLQSDIAPYIADGTVRS